MPAALAAHRAAEVLCHVAHHPGRRFTLTHLAAELAVSPAAMHAVLAALVGAGLLERDQATKAYRLGPECVVLGSAARAQHEDVALAGLAARRVADAHGLAVTVLARSDDEIVVLDRVGGTDPDGVGTLQVAGRRLPFAPPFGTVFLARARPQDVVAWFLRAGIDPAGELAERYRAELDRVAERGWSVVGALADCGDSGQALAQLIADPMQPHRSPEWVYLVDDLATTDAVLPIAVVLGLEGLVGGRLALAVSGFEQRLRGSEVVAFADRLVRTAMMSG